MTPMVVYKICTGEEWQNAQSRGVYQGSALDQADGFIHLSTARQVDETMRLHFAGIAGLVLLEVATEGLDIRYENARGGQLFPHLYGDLPLAAIRSAAPCTNHLSRASPQSASDKPTPNKPDQDPKGRS